MNAKTFSLDSKAAAGKKLWAIGGCVAALVISQLFSSGTAQVGFAPVRMLVVLGCFCGAAFWLMRKLPRAQAGGLEPALKVVGKTSLGPRNGLALVEADGIRVLVAFGEGFSQVLPLDAIGSKKEIAP